MLPVRYVEFMVALCFQTAPEYIVIIVLGKTLGGVLTYKACHLVLQFNDLQLVFLSNGLSLYVNSISDLVRERPFLYGLTFRTFFPSVLNCVALAMLPLNLSQFVLIQFIHALILAWPQAALDYYPFIDKKTANSRHMRQEYVANEHADIIRRGLETRMDVYKLGFVVVQIATLAWLMWKVQNRYRQLTQRFISNVKLRLI